MLLEDKSRKLIVTVAPVLNTLQGNGSGCLPEISASDSHAENSVPGMWVPSKLLNKLHQFLTIWHYPLIITFLPLFMFHFSNPLVVREWILTLLTTCYTRNAVNQETAQGLTEELSAFDQDNSLNVAVLYGVGGNFCAGFDLKELAQSSGSLKLEQDVCRGPDPMGPSRMRLSKPLIAAVSVYAVAGGLELALPADLRVVEESSIMGVFCRRFGVPLIDGGKVRLPQLIGLSRALDLILTVVYLMAKVHIHYTLKLTRQLSSIAPWSISVAYLPIIGTFGSGQGHHGHSDQSVAMQSHTQ
uniref:Zgc:101569 n=1 Tax=Sinocyclocheilus anshuiensis TaxID=1608454 RepID=A0A671KPH2_9TELE